MSISASAKVEIPMENGAKLIVYEEGDTIPALRATRSVPMVFSNTFPVYPSYNFVHGRDGDESIPIYSHNTIRITFDERESSLYMNVYDSSLGEFVQIGSSQNSNGLHYISNPSLVYDIEGLPAYHIYKIGFASRSQSQAISGTITTTD